MKVITFGSCMSEGVLSALAKLIPNKKIIQLNHIIHNRSDYFLKCFITNEWRPVELDNSNINKIDIQYSSEFHNLDMKSEAFSYISNQSADYLGVNKEMGRISALKNIMSAKVDLFILDNFMDIASMLACEKETNSKYFLFSGAFKHETFNALYDWSAAISAKESVENWIQIINWLQLNQPKAKIYFAPFPGYVFNNEERQSVQRAQEFKKILININFPATVLNTPDVNRESMNSTTDWSHYKSDYYNLIASQLKSDISEKLL